jgi:hypothetical protein
MKKVHRISIAAAALSIVISVSLAGGIITAQENGPAMNRPERPDAGQRPPLLRRPRCGWRRYALGNGSRRYSAGPAPGL